MIPIGGSLQHLPRQAKWRHGWIGTPPNQPCVIWLQVLTVSLIQYKYGTNYGMSVILRGTSETNIIQPSAIDRTYRPNMSNIKPTWICKFGPKWRLATICSICLILTTKTCHSMLLGRWCLCVWKGSSPPQDHCTKNDLMKTPNEKRWFPGSLHVYRWHFLTCHSSLCIQQPASQKSLSLSHELRHAPTSVATISQSTTKPNSNTVLPMEAATYATELETKWSRS